MIDGGFVIDTPGFSSIELPPVKDIEELASLFPEFHEHQSCKYSNCVHINEPNCGVKEALENKISKERYEFYLWCYNYYKNERWNRY
jgi:ribosome biogenesis GTPase